MQTPRRSRRLSHLTPEFDGLVIESMKKKPRLEISTKTTTTKRKTLRTLLRSSSSSGTPTTPTPTGNKLVLFNEAGNAPAERSSSPTKVLLYFAFFLIATLSTLALAAVLYAFREEISTIAPGLRQQQQKEEISYDFHAPVFPIDLIKAIRDEAKLARAYLEEGGGVEVS